MSPTTNYIFYWALGRLHGPWCKQPLGLVNLICKGCGVCSYMNTWQLIQTPNHYESNMLKRGSKLKVTCENGDKIYVICHCIYILNINSNLPIIHSTYMYVPIRIMHMIVWFNWHMFTFDTLEKFFWKNNLAPQCITFWCPYLASWMFKG